MEQGEGREEEARGEEDKREEEKSNEKEGRMERSRRKKEGRRKKQGGSRREKYKRRGVTERGIEKWKLGQVDDTDAVSCIAGGTVAVWHSLISEVAVWLLPSLIRR